ncbi:leucyl aminopeptidase family protein [Motilibacter aurantiacus]|uniref:leucyl aminopeptidase family protein n=1 Tax=Motilibacter aurantiacus TaxID=2714955 RepID=UPI00140D21D8|nr:M17 family peptidase N-terminal domain-containing protein [Motilibacter aurantiacus]NHC45730.1 leucyl aminopeptidase [Motilibacter aurantiacus]
MPRSAPAGPRSRARTGAPAALPREPQLPQVTVAGTVLVDAAVPVLAIPVVPGADGPRPGAGTREVEQAFGVVVADELALAKAKGEPGEIVEVPVADEGRAAEQLYLVGVGDGSDLALRRAGAALARRARARGAVATTVAADSGPAGLRAFAEGVVGGSYRQPRAGLAPEGDTLRTVAVVVPASRRARAEEALARALETGRALCRARDLANTPADVAGPVELAAEAARLAAVAGLEARVWDEAELAAGGFGGLLAVGGGSARPPRLVQLSYAPGSDGALTGRGGRRAPHVVLVGKGIAFDSGGLSLKPREAMVPMKTDMSGGGVVLAVMAALQGLGVRARVTGLVPFAENSIGGASYRPGDVITQFGGTTVEVLNTDAEGRLVLADAMAYAHRELAPDVIVDIATLTGAASLGLGRRHGALYATDDALADALLEAADASGERLWRMPLEQDYRAALASPVADLAHVTRDKHVGAGSITAALFLQEFTGGRRWAHLDVAGPARSDGDEHEVTKGGTGFGTRLLLRWLEGVR